jgi:hypothetical protein
MIVLVFSVAGKAIFPQPFFMDFTGERQAMIFALVSC